MRILAHWRLRTRTLELGRRTLVMGVVNITPDSFSDGGSFLDPEAALARCKQCVEEGADILDLGAESTRPGSRAGGHSGGQVGGIDALGSAVARLSAAGGGRFSTSSTSAERAPTPALPRKRGRGSAAVQAVTTSSSLE